MKEKICPNCNKSMPFNSYFQKYYCDSCGHMEEKEDKLLIYVSHPYSAKEENKQKVEVIVRKLAKEHPKHTFLSPVHAVGFMYDDFDYETGLNMCLELLKRCDIMYVYGDWENSVGCKAEIKFAEENGILYKIF